VRKYRSFADGLAIDLKRATSLVQNLADRAERFLDLRRSGGASTKSPEGKSRVAAAMVAGRRTKIPRLAPKAASLTRVARAARRG
jgi:hypothetical protein